MIAPAPRKARASSLQDRIERSTALAQEHLTALRAVPLEELESRVKHHTLGENAYGWTSPYPPEDPRSLLKEYQFLWFRDRARFKCGLMARQTGKDFSSEGEAVEDCLARPTEWMVAAPSERQALDSLDQAKTWAQAMGLMVEDYKEDRDGHSQALLKSAEVQFTNKSRIRAVPGSPNTVRGRSVNILLTEFDFFEDPSATWRAMLPSITNPLRGGEKKVRVLSTPNGTGGALHKIWTKEDTAQMQWSRHLVNLYHAVLCGLPVDVEQLRQALDDPEGFSQECLCQFLDGSNVLLPYDLIQMAESFEATEVWDMEQAGSSNPIFCGIDFGRVNDPTVCWTLQQIGDVLWTREVLRLDGMSTPDQEAALRPRIARATRVALDFTGPGIGLGDYLVDPKRGNFGRWHPEAHEFGKLELCTFTTGFKRRIFPNLRSAFRDAQGKCRLRIPVSTAIREDLHAMRQVITNGEYNYWAPRTKEGHSDRCTALALAVHAAGKPAAAMGAILI